MTLTLDLNLGPMTFILEFGLDVMKIHLHTKNKVSRSWRSKVMCRKVILIICVTLTLTFDLWGKKLGSAFS